MRVVSLLPAATEIVAALGLADALVGVSHECDYPPALVRKPRVTRCDIHAQGLSSAAVDRWVNETLAARGALYTLDEPLLRDLQPDIILTQRLCDVCAVGYGSVAGFAQTLPKQPHIVNLEPSSLEDIFSDIRRVAAALGVKERGNALVAALVQRVQWVSARAANVTHRPRCLHMEWVDPPFCGGHWNPELVGLAGGIDPLGRPRAPSSRIAWQQVIKAQPDVMVVACCGYSVERTLQDIGMMYQYPDWNTLPAVQHDRVYAVNGSAYFSRPGPRVVDSLEILAELVHPELFHGCFPDRGTVRVAAQSALFT